MKADFCFAVAMMLMVIGGLQIEDFWTRVLVVLAVFTAFVAGRLDHN